jgi:hypothetical protein
VREPLRRVHEAMLGLLERFTIAELAREGKPDRNPAGQHPIQQIQIQPVKPELRHENAYLPG